MLSAMKSGIHREERESCRDPVMIRTSATPIPS
jgi:hypothetical protein